MPRTAPFTKEPKLTALPDFVTRDIRTEPNSRVYLAYLTIATLLILGRAF